MNTHIPQIAERIRGLRDALHLSTSDVASTCGISVSDYEKYESGAVDIPVSFICELAQKFNIETTALISGNDPHATSFWITRKGTGPNIERNKTYNYQSLAAGFRNSAAEVFEVTIEPTNSAIALNSHSGQEFNLVLEGIMQLNIGENTLTLNQGDSIYFDATKPHGMKALNGKKVCFLAVII